MMSRLRHVRGAAAAADADAGPAAPAAPAAPPAAAAVPAVVELGIAVGWVAAASAAGALPAALGAELGGAAAARSSWDATGWTQRGQRTSRTSHASMQATRREGTGFRVQGVGVVLSGVWCICQIGLSEDSSVLNALSGIRWHRHVGM